MEEINESLHLQLLDFDKEKNNNKLYTIAYIGNNQADKAKDIPLANARGSATIKSTKALKVKSQFSVLMNCVPLIVGVLLYL